MTLKVTRIKHNYLQKMQFYNNQVIIRTQRQSLTSNFSTFLIATLGKGISNCQIHIVHIKILRLSKLYANLCFILGRIAFNRPRLYLGRQSRRQHIVLLRLYLLEIYCWSFVWWFCMRFVFLELVFWLFDKSF